MRSQITPFTYQTHLKDSEIATNAGSSQSHCVKTIMGKFFRKPDSVKAQKKKKSSDQDKSLICYMTPKNCEESNKLIKEKMKQCRSQIDINTFLGNAPAQSVNFGLNKSMTRACLRKRSPEGQTSLEKHNVVRKQELKIVLNKKQSAELYQIKRPQIQKQKSSKINPHRNQIQFPLDSSVSALKNPQTCVIQKQPLPNSNQEKQLKKLKNQCQYYSNLLQQNKLKKEQLQKINREMLTQAKSLLNFTNKTPKLQAVNFKYFSDLKAKILSLEQQNTQFKKKAQLFEQQKIKMHEQISYLKDTVKQLNGRIDELSSDKFQNLEDTYIPKLSLITSSLRPNKRFSAFDCTGRLFNSPQYHQASKIHTHSQVQNKLIQELQNELKYCQVQINMLKRVKLDVNKKNDEFTKIQRQNKILKDQIFELKTSPMIEEHNSKPVTKRLTHQNIGSANRNNFQITLQRGGRGKQGDKGSQSCSSDTLSLNLSLSPQKQRRRV